MQTKRDEKECSRGQTVHQELIKIPQLRLFKKFVAVKCPCLFYVMKGILLHSLNQIHLIPKHMISEGMKYF